MSKSFKSEKSKPNIDEVLAKMQRLISERSKEISEFLKLPSDQSFIIEFSYLQGIVDAIGVLEKTKFNILYENGKIYLLKSNKHSNLLHLLRILLHLLHSKKKEDYI